MTTDNPDPLEVWSAACGKYEDACEAGDTLRDGVVLGDQAAAAIIAQNYAPVIAEKADLEALVGELEAAVVILRREAVLLLNNSEGCARNHYGDDCQTFGMPQWLIDSRRNIEQAFRCAEDATLAKLEKARGKDQTDG